MKVAFFSDVHGNLIALEDCLAAMDRLGIEERYFIGDAVGYLSDDLAVLGRLGGGGAICQQGNHEAMLLGGAGITQEKERVYRLGEARERLKAAGLIEMLMGWPRSREMEIAGKRFLLIHGAPDAPLFGYLYPDSDLSQCQGLPYDFVVMGNTHRPFIRYAGGVTCVNVGSVGLPRDQGNLASFAVYDSRDACCEIVRVSVDIDRILRQYGQDLSPSVVECFQRKSLEIVGKVI